MTFFKYPFALLCGLSLSLQAAAAPCGYAALEINPLSAARTETYVGYGKKVEVLFANEATDPVVETFPESSLKVRHIATNVTCEIDGGIWVRNAVYLSADERLLIAKQFSGANESLSFYDTRTCALKAQVDVSDRAWKIEPKGLLLGERCANGQLQSCKRTRVHSFSSSCLARHTKNSTQKTKG
jgi:hypothetical protein